MEYFLSGDKKIMRFNYRMQVGKCMFLILMLLILSCEDNRSERGFETYNHRSKELISQWLSKFSENTDITCIKQFRSSVDVSEEERTLILQKLKIADEKHLTEQLEYSFEFQLTDSLVGNLRLISFAQQQELEEMDKNGEPYWEWYNASCQGEWLEISKPIFNEDYSLAYFTSYTTCAVGSCGSGGKSVMKWEGDKWITIDNFDLVIH